MDPTLPNKIFTFWAVVISMVLVSSGYAYVIQYIVKLVRKIQNPDDTNEFTLNDVHFPWIFAILWLMTCFSVSYAILDQPIHPFTNPIFTNPIVISLEMLLSMVITSLAYAYILRYVARLIDKIRTDTDEVPTYKTIDDHVPWLFIILILVTVASVANLTFVLCYQPTHSL